MKQPLFEGVDLEVTNDLCKKVVIDIHDTIMRTVELAPPPRSAIVTAAGATAVGMLAVIIQQQTDVPLDEDGKPGVPALVLAAMILARFCINRKTDYIHEAMEDVEVLMRSKRFR